MGLVYVGTESRYGRTKGDGTMTRGSIDDPVKGMKRFQRETHSGVVIPEGTGRLYVAVREG